jgi:YHS domain-containing protein
VREIADHVLWLEDGTFQQDIATERDPVCGRTIEVRGSPLYIYAELTYHFCGDRCLALFKQSPEQFVQPAAGSLKGLEGP